MHEWALAEAVVAAVASNIEGGGDLEAVVVVGELQQVDLDAFKFALEELKRERGLDVPLKVVVEEARLRCRACGHEWSWREAAGRLDEASREAVHFVPELVHSFARCPRCGSADYEIIRGRGVYVKVVRRE